MQKTHWRSTGNVLKGKGLEINSLSLLSEKRAINWLKYVFNSSGCGLNDHCWHTYINTDETPEFASKYIYWLSDSGYICNEGYIREQSYYNETASCLPVVGVKSNNFGKQFKICSDNSGVTVKKIGNEIFIDVEEMDGLVINSIKAYDSDENEIDIVDNKFTMIRDDVTIEVIRKKRGDIDGDNEITMDDAIYLFNATMFPEEYPISAAQKTDYNGDGTFDMDDAIYLFNHTMFPEEYPI